jgi:hypothetical protein
MGNVIKVVVARYKTRYKTRYKRESWTDHGLTTRLSTEVFTAHRVFTGGLFTARLGVNSCGLLWSVRGLTTRRSADRPRTDHRVTTNSFYNTFYNTFYNSFYNLKYGPFSPLPPLPPDDK